MTTVGSTGTSKRRGKLLGKNPNGAPPSVFSGLDHGGYCCLRGNHRLTVHASSVTLLCWLCWTSNLSTLDPIFFLTRQPHLTFHRRRPLYFTHPKPNLNSSSSSSFSSFHDSHPLTSLTSFAPYLASLLLDFCEPVLGRNCRPLPAYLTILV